MSSRISGPTKRQYCRNQSSENPSIVRGTFVILLLYVQYCVALSRSSQHCSIATSKRRKTPIRTSARSRCAATNPTKSPTSSSNCFRSILRSNAHPTRDGMALPPFPRNVGPFLCAIDGQNHTARGGTRST
eukprot:scaffold24_cov341-Pavlova_lutheri.AAC.103